MKSLRTLFVGSILAIVLLAVAISASAKVRTTAPQIEASPQNSLPEDVVHPGNYCLSCHTEGDQRLVSASDWKGGIAREEISGCTAATSIHEELYYTERLLLAIDRLNQEVPDRFDTSTAEARLTAAHQSYSRLLDEPIDSLDAFISEAQILRFRLGKVYSQLTQFDETVKRQRVLFFGGLVSLGLISSLGWGFYNTQKGIQKLRRRTKNDEEITKTGESYLSWFTPGRILAVMIVFAFFSLPIFKVFPQETEMASAEEQERQAVLDTADRAADTADQAIARSWVLGRVGAAWSALDPEQGKVALSSALEAADTAQEDATALWGQAQAAREAGIAAPIDLETANLISSQLKAARSRAWGLQMIAYDWSALDPSLAEDILERALTTVESSLPPFRDLDLRSIAVTWASIDSQRGLALAQQIQDPAIRAWGLREIAALGPDQEIYELAAQAARKVANPVQRARALREVAVASGDESLFTEALESLASVHGPALAYALSDLAAASQNPAMVEKIDPLYMDARAAALLGLGDFQGAWEAAAQISDPYEQTRAQAAIAASSEDTGMARQITIATLRDLALRDIAVSTGDPSLVDEIASSYYRVSALTALGHYEDAWKEVEDLKEPYPLVSLAQNWAEDDPNIVLEIIEVMDREADKAVALRTVAAVTGDDELFDRALGMAYAARVRGDALAPVEASLALADEFVGKDTDKAQAAFTQAFEAAVQITTK